MATSCSFFDCFIDCAAYGTDLPRESEWRRNIRLCRLAIAAFDHGDVRVCGFLEKFQGLCPILIYRFGVFFINARTLR